MRSGGGCGGCGGRGGDGGGVSGRGLGGEVARPAEGGVQAVRGVRGGGRAGREEPVLLLCRGRRGRRQEASHSLAQRRFAPLGSWPLLLKLNLCAIIVCFSDCFAQYDLSWRLMLDMNCPDVARHLDKDERGCSCG